MAVPESAQTMQDIETTLFADDPAESATEYASADDEIHSDTPRQRSIVLDATGQYKDAMDSSGPPSEKRSMHENVPSEAHDKCRLREVDYSLSLRSDLYDKKHEIDRLRQKFRERGLLSRSDKADTLQRQSTAMKNIIQTQEAELGALRIRLEENSTLQQKIQRERDMADQMHQEELDSMRSQFEDSLRTTMDEFLKHSNANFEGFLQQQERRMEERLKEELEKASRVMTADRERDIAAIEQRYAHRGQASGYVSSSPGTSPNPQRAQHANTPNKPSSRNHASPGPSVPGTSPKQTRDATNTPSPTLDAIQRIKRFRGISRTTKLVAIKEDDANGCQPNPTSLPGPAESVEEDDSTLPTQSAQLPSSFAETIAKAVEEIVRTTLSGARVATESPTRRSPRRKKVEDREIQLQKNIEPSEHRDFILGEVRRLFKDVFNITQDVEFLTHQPAPVSDVHAFELEDGLGPCVNSLQFDLSKNHSSPWNTEVLEILLRRFQQRCEDEKWPITRTDNYIREVLRHHYKRLRTTWLRAQPKLTHNGVPETPAEVEERMTKYLAQLGKDARQATRRHNKYSRRMSILNHAVALRSETGDDDLDAWKWLQSLIRTLGENGMSSEESAVENEVEHILRVKKMEWRRCINRELVVVDAQRILDSDIFSPRGAKPVKRVRALDNLVSSRDPVVGLPVNLYDCVWMAGLTRHQVESLQIPEGSFEWIKIAVVNST